MSKSYSKSELARMAGVSYSTFYRYLKSRRLYVSDGSESHNDYKGGQYAYFSKCNCFVSVVFTHFYHLELRVAAGSPQAAKRNHSPGEMVSLSFGRLPAVFDVFAECVHILDFKNSTVVENNIAVPEAVNLMAVHSECEYVHIRMMIIEGLHGQIESAVL